MVSPVGDYLWSALRRVAGVVQADGLKSRLIMEVLSVLAGLQKLLPI